MEILLIGNGFDLEHKLPTSYKNFLEFCEKVRRIFTFSESTHLSEYRRKNIDNWEIDDSIKEVLLLGFEKRTFKRILKEDTNFTETTTPYDVLNELYVNLSNNVWLDYFLTCPSYIGENWIDFELEISRVIQALDATRFQISHGGNIQNIKKSDSVVIVALLNATKGSMRAALQDTAAINKFSEFLNAELEKLIRALEIYIAEFVGKITISTKSVDIENLHPDCVLSFNYSDTYERVYGNGKKIQYDYIHGKADIRKSVKSSDLVLGIDEYLGDDRKNCDLEFLPFKKYYQRIYKSTGNVYLNWVGRIKKDDAEYHRKVNLAYTREADPLYSFPWQKRYYLNVSSIECPEHTLYIFGHSLDITDKDVLKLFICNDNVQTKIFYHRKSEDDKTALRKLIRNLVQIMGQDELIRRTGGTCKTIEFIPQTLSHNEQ